MDDSCDLSCQNEIKNFAALKTRGCVHEEKLAKEGEEGRKKIIQYTRYGTVILAIIQTFFISLWLENPNAFQGTVIVPNPGWGFRLMTMLTLTTGTAFIMWLGEQIDQYGIGNGMSIIITAGIIESVPTALWQTFLLLSPFDPARQQLAWWKFALMLALYVGVVIEEDGKTEEEFIEEIIALNDELGQLNDNAKSLEKIINQNINKFTEEE